MRRAAVIVNPAARGGASLLAGHVASRLGETFDRVEVVPNAAAGGGVEAARTAVASPGMELIVAVGGDGTAREVAQGMAEGLGTWDGAASADAGAPRLLIVPAGTGNSVHHALWGDLPWPESLALLERGAVVRRDLDLARIEGHGRAVLLGASAGFLRWTVEATARFPELSGRELYATAGLAAAQELRPYAGRVSVDGEVVCEGPTALAVVGGARRRGGSLEVLPRSALDDGLLDVCVLCARGADEAMGLLLLAMEGRHLEQPGVVYAQGRRITLECLDGPLPFEHDGDVWSGEEESLTLSVVPGAVPVVVPA